MCQFSLPKNIFRFLTRLHTRKFWAKSGPIVWNVEEIGREQWRRQVVQSVCWIPRNVIFFPPWETCNRGGGGANANRNITEVFIIAWIVVYAKGYLSIHTVSGVYALECTAYTAAPPMVGSHPWRDIIFIDGPFLDSTTIRGVAGIWVQGGGRARYA